MQNILKTTTLKSPVIKQEENIAFFITPIKSYNEEEIIEYTIERLSALLKTMIKDALVSPDSKICFVNDGSKDKTLNIIEQNIKTNPNIALINLTRNFGQQYALLAGMNCADSDIVVTIDADLQDDPNIVINMVKEYQKLQNILL